MHVLAAQDGKVRIARRRSTTVPAIHALTALARIYIWITNAPANQVGTARIATTISTSARRMRLRLQRVKTVQRVSIS